MILLLLPLDVQADMVRELLAPSDDEILGPSDTGDLIDSLLGCLLREALMARGMHFKLDEVFSSISSPTESNCLQLLHFQILGCYKCDRGKDK